MTNFSKTIETSIFVELVSGAALYMRWNERCPITDTRTVTWTMISDKTGIHTVITESSKICDRVTAHWDGFKKNHLNT